MSAGGKFPHSSLGRGLGIALDHWSLRREARKAMQDSPQGRAIVESKTDAIAGVGLKLEPTPGAAVLGITPEQAAEWARDVGARFNLWAEDKAQHRAGSLTFNQGQRLYTYFKERDNDIFVRLYYSPDRTLQNPLQFEFIDPDQIRGDAYTTSYGGFPSFPDGIERDSRGRETAYWVQLKKKDGGYEYVKIQARGTKSGRVFMLHGYQPEYAGQGRGFTKLAPILQELKLFEDYTLAHIMQAMTQARIVAWEKPGKDEDGRGAAFDGMVNHGAGPAGKGLSAEAASGGGSGLGEFVCHDLPENPYSQPSGVLIQGMGKGSDIKFPNPSSPSTTYDRFQEAFLKGVSATLRTPMEVAHMTFGKSFSASRATLLLFQRVLEIERQDMVADFLLPVYTMWISGEIAAGRISAPGWLDPRIKNAWLKATWRGSPVPDIDPGKLAKARRDNLETAVTNIEFEAQTHSGKSAEENIAINNQAYQDYKSPPFVTAGNPKEEEEEDDA